MTPETQQDHLVGQYFTGPQLEHLVRETGQMNKQGTWHKAQGIQLKCWTKSLDSPFTNGITAGTIICQEFPINHIVHILKGT